MPAPSTSMAAPSARPCARAPASSDGGSPARRPPPEVAGLASNLPGNGPMDPYDASFSLLHATPRPSANARSLEAEWPSLADLKLGYIERAIAHTRGNKTHAAVLLGIDRRTLNRILA